MGVAVDGRHRSQNARLQADLLRAQPASTAFQGRNTPVTRTRLPYFCLSWL